MNTAHVWKDETERRSLRDLSRSIGRFRDIYADMTAPQMLLLLYIGIEGETVQKELAERLGLTTAAVSRNIATLSPLPQAGGKEGYGLLTWTDHPTDRRSKLVVLTPKGRTFIASLLA